MCAQIKLKPGKEKPIKNFHHWIFSGALQARAECADGEIVAVLSSKDEHLGYAYVNRKSSIYGRMISFDQTSPEVAIERNFLSAIKLRQELIGKDTNAYRLVNAEADRLPGLILDKYNDVFVLQISTLGMEKLKDLICGLIRKNFSPRVIFERSDSASRKNEGLKDVCGPIYGELPEEVRILENNLTFHVDISGGQKTGFFLDQRRARMLVKELAYKRKVLNLFAYSGAFSVYALSGNARQADSVDSSEPALKLAEKNLVNNNFDPKKNKCICADVFEFVRENPIDHDLVIIDPPAFAKNKESVVKACRAYKDINRLVMEKIPQGGLILTCSCSYYVDPGLFQTVIFQAAAETKRQVRILQRHHLAFDHPVNIYHPEGDYLKSLLLRVD